MIMKIDLDSMVSVSEASSRGVSKLVTEAEAGKEWVILRGSKPAAAMIGMDRLRRLQELEAREHEMGYVMTAIGRLMTETTSAISVEDLQNELGLEPDDLITPTS